MQIGQVVQWTGKALQGAALVWDQELSLGTAGSKSPWL